jgi:threonine dehydratase
MIDLADVEQARQRIADGVAQTPCTYSEKLSRLTGCRLYLKRENLQMTGAYKERGALNKILCLSEAQRAAGVIAASAGNHAQGVGRAAQLLGIKAVIVMPETTPLAKIRGTLAFGAEIVLHGSGYDEACGKAMELQEQHGYTFIHAFDDPLVIAGQGTIGLELLEQVPDMDVLVSPVGGGGVIAGVAAAIKPVRPEVRIIGVETALLPAMQASLAAGRITPLPAAKTLADGISVSVVGSNTFPIAQRYVEAVTTVTEEEIANAILTLLEREKTLAEGAGAVAVAALLQDRIENIEGKTVVAIITGGNIDMTLLSRIIERGLELDGRLAWLRLVVPDKPGSIAEIANIIAGHRANISDLSQSRPASDVQLGQAEVELRLEARGRDHVEEIVASLREAGIKVL